MSDIPQFTLTLPTKTFDDKVALSHGGEVVEVLYFGPGVTRGDAVVWLPNERILVTGDLFDNPIPFAYGCDVGGWIASLEALEELDAHTIVPGHGEVLKSEGRLALLRACLRSIQEETQEAVKRGDTAEQARANVTALDFRTSLARSNKMLQSLFDNFFASGVVGSAFKEASAK